MTWSKSPGRLRGAVVRCNIRVGQIKLLQSTAEEIPCSGVARISDEEKQPGQHQVRARIWNLTLVKHYIGSAELHLPASNQSPFPSRTVPPMQAAGVTTHPLLVGFPEKRPGWLIPTLIAHRRLLGGFARCTIVARQALR